jgi:translation initiation factor 2B subunit (eIF-2B alpha/beta/delta family)
LAKLQKSISRTRFESSIRLKLELILYNRTEGATAIEEATFDLINFILESRYSDSALIQNSIEKIESRFPLMSNIITLHSFIKNQVNRISIEGLSKKLERYKKQLEKSRLDTTISAAQLIKSYNSIFTLSNSSAVRNAILKATNSGWKGMVYIIESRPKNEGTILAASLARHGIMTQLSVDAFMPEMIRQSDAIFLGCDCVTESYIVNKIGSNIAAEYAAKNKKPVFILADNAKIVSGRKYRFVGDNNPARELTNFKHKNLTIVDPYFEKIRFSGPITVICGKQILRNKDIKYFLKYSSGSGTLQ